MNSLHISCELLLIHFNRVVLILKVESVILPFFTQGKNISTSPILLKICCKHCFSHMN